MQLPLKEVFLLILLRKIAKHFILTNTNYAMVHKNLNYCLPWASKKWINKNKILKLSPVDEYEKHCSVSSLFEKVLESRSVIRLLIPSPITDEKAVKRAALNQWNTSVRYCTAHSTVEICSICLRGSFEKSHIHYSRFIELKKLEHYTSLFLHGFIHS